MTGKDLLRMGGALGTLVAGLLLMGWLALDWRFVDPFLATLCLVGAPFFVGMGMVDPNPAPKKKSALA